MGVLVDIPMLDDVRAYLNSMGEQGWELVTVADVDVEPRRTANQHAHAAAIRLQTTEK